MDTVVHLASTQGSKDVAVADRLCVEARRAGIAHLVLISIVDVDRIPLGFYRDRFRIEHIVTGSGLPHTVLRSSQFHSLVAGMFRAQRRLPVLVVPGIGMQPIAVPEVAARLAELVAAGPQGRVGDIGGPERRPAREFAELWQQSLGRHRPVVPLRLPGKIFAAYDAGAGLVPGTPYGKGTFADHLATQA